MLFAFLCGLIISLFLMVAGARRWLQRAAIRAEIARLHGTVLSIDPIGPFGWDGLRGWIERLVAATFRVGVRKPNGSIVVKRCRVRLIGWRVRILKRELVHRSRAAGGGRAAARAMRVEVPGAAPPD